MLNVLIITWSHPFDVVDGIAQLFELGLVQNDASVKLANISTKQGVDLVLKAVKENNTQLVIGMNLDAYQFKIDGLSIFELMKSRFAVFYMDHPIYTNQFIDNLLPILPHDSIFIFCDSDHERHMRQYFDSCCNGRFVTIFIPYGTVEPYELSYEKDLDLVVFCTLDGEICKCISSNKNPKINFPFFDHMPSSVLASKRRIIDIVNELVYGKFNLDIIGCLENAIGVDEIFNDPIYRNTIQIFDSYIKRYRRINSLNELLKASDVRYYKAAVYGSGWDMIPGINKKFIINPPVPYLHQFDIFKRSKVVFNCDPNWSSGVHDRVFNAISRNCSVLTNSNKFTDMYFRNGYNSTLYNSTSEIQFKVFEAIESWYGLSMNSQKTIFHSHSYKKRFSLLVDCL